MLDRAGLSIQVGQHRDLTDLPRHIRHRLVGSWIRSRCTVIAGR